MSAENTGPNGSSAWLAAFETIAEGILAGAPDCWPAVRGAVYAIRNAANRAVNFAWRVVDQREATIRSLTAQLDSCLSGSYYRQDEFQACTRELAAAQADQAASVALINQLRSSLSLNQRNAAACAAAVQQARAELASCASAREEQAAQLVQLRSQNSEQIQTIKQLRAQVGKPRPCPPCPDCAAEVSRATGPLRQQVATLTEEFNRLAVEKQQLVTDNTQLAYRNAQLTNYVNLLTSQLTTCQDKLRICENQNGEVKQLRTQLIQCQNQQNVSRETIVRQQQQHGIDERTIIELRSQNGHYVNQITYVQNQLTQCNQQRQKECPPYTCQQLSRLRGTCTAT